MEIFTDKRSTTWKREERTFRQKTDKVSGTRKSIASSKNKISEQTDLELELDMEEAQKEVW